MILYSRIARSYKFINTFDIEIFWEFSLLSVLPEVIEKYYDRSFWMCEIRCVGWSEDSNNLNLNFYMVIRGLLRYPLVYCYKYIKDFVDMTINISLLHFFPSDIVFRHLMLIKKITLIR